MDPDEYLNEQLEISKRILDGDEEIDENDVSRLAELVVSLHEWMTSGGFMPAAWEENQD